MTTINDLDDFKALEPFFRIIEQGLDGLADGGHFFDLLAEDVVFDYIITTPGYPRHVEGRQAVAELYRPYGDTIVLDRCHDLAVHHDPNTGVVVLEYASQGRVVPTGAPYANRYISVLTIADRKVTRWRDWPWMRDRSVPEARSAVLRPTQAPPAQAECRAPFGLRPADHAASRPAWSTQDRARSSSWRPPMSILE
jgi:uncharacterized protein